MKTKLKRYKEYKDSGVEWLGEIPEHWVTIRMKHIFKDYSEKNKPEAVLLSVTQTYGVVPRDMVENRMVMPTGNLETFKYIQKGDFAISLRSFEGGLEYSNYNGIISPAYTVLRLKFDMQRPYLKHLFKSYSFIFELQTSVIGIREGKNISYPELSYSFLPIPPITEQKAIADYLDKKTAQIDKAIAQKEQIIELLKERKQILINKAVTRGLNPDVPLKDSGIDWIGEIPEHWEVRKLKFSMENISQKIISKDSILQYIGMENIESGTGNHISSDSEVEGLANHFKKGDILFGKLRPYLAKVHLAQFEGICSTEFLVYRVMSFYVNVYIKYLLLSNSFIQKVDSSTYGSKMPRANPEYVGNMFIPYPPRKEQIDIAEYIETNSQKINSAITQKHLEIEKLKEYKATLIDSAVTGKICLTDN